MSGARARVLPLLLWALAVAAALVLILRTPFTADLSAFLPASPDARQRLLIEQIHSGTPARTLLMGISGGDATARAQASRELARSLRASGRFDAVHNGETEAWAGVGEWLFAQRYLLSPAVAPERFTPEGLREGIAEATSLLGTPAGESLKALLPRDPTGEMQRVGEALIPARSPRTEQGVWVAREAPRALLMATIKAAGADLDAQAAAIDSAHQAFAPAAARGLKLDVSGAPVFGVDSRARIESEVHRLALWGTLAMVLLLWLAFGSLPALAVAALPVATGVVCGIAAVAAGFGTVHGMTLGFGSTLIGESVDYAIYYLVQARQGGWRGWLRSSWPTVRLGLVTSVVGFAALVFSGFPGLAQLGVFSVAGLLGAAAATRWLLPVLMPEGARGQGLRAALGRGMRSAARGLPHLKLAVWMFGVAAASVLVMRGDLWRADLASLSPVPAPLLALDRELRADLGHGDSGTLVVVQGADVQATLQAAEAASARLEALIDSGVIAGFDSVTRFVPSLATQRQRQAALPEPAALEAALEAATEGGPLPAARLQGFLADVQAARTQALVQPQSLAGQPVAPLVDALLMRRADGSAAALLPLQAGARDIDSAAVQKALSGLPQAQVLDIGQELSQLYRRYLGEAQGQALLGAAAVVVLMALALRSPRRLLAVCQPLALAVLLTLGGLAALGQSLGILHLVGLLLVVAVGSNYALFFDSAGGAADDDTLASLLLANLTTVASFGLLAMSSIPVLAAIGQVVAPGALLALVLAAVFAPRRPGDGPVKKSSA